MSNTNNKLLTVKEVAELLDVAPRTVRRLIHSEKLPAINVAVGKKRNIYRIRQSEAERLMNDDVDFDVIHSIEPFLLYGAENARQGSELAKNLNLDPFDLRLIIADDRDKGVPICANDSGYFLAKSLDEINAYVTGQVAELNRRCERLNQMFIGAEKNFPTVISDADLEVVDTDAM